MMGRDNDMYWKGKQYICQFINKVITNCVTVKQDSCHQCGLPEDVSLLNHHLLHKSYCSAVKCHSFLMMLY